MTADTETKLADALRACLPYVLHFKRKAKREADAGGLEHFVTKCEALLAAHDTARAQPASVTDDYREIARLIGCIFFYGGFKAETRNERDLEALLRRTGNFYETEAQLLAAAPQRKE